MCYSRFQSWTNSRVRPAMKPWVGLQMPSKLPAENFQPWLFRCIPSLPRMTATTIHMNPVSGNVSISSASYVLLCLGFHLFQKHVETVQSADPPLLDPSRSAFQWFSFDVIFLSPCIHSIAKSSCDMLGGQQGQTALTALALPYPVSEICEFSFDKRGCQHNLLKDRLEETLEIPLWEHMWVHGFQPPRTTAVTTAVPGRCQIFSAFSLSIGRCIRISQWP